MAREQDHFMLLTTADIQDRWVWWLLRSIVGAGEIKQMAAHFDGDETLSLSEITYQYQPCSKAILFTFESSNSSPSASDILPEAMTCLHLPVCQLVSSLNSCFFREHVAHLGRRMRMRPRLRTSRKK
jgi:hypothetical protein